MKSVRIAELKNHLSEYLRAARRGDSIMVLDRDTPIARIVPYARDSAEVRIREAHDPARLRRWRRLPRLRLEVDPVALLLADRRRR